MSFQLLTGVAVLYLATEPAAAQFASAINLSTLDGTIGFRLDGVAASDYSGLAVTSAGDVNGDGFADVIVGAHLADPNAVDRSGASYVVFGKAGGFAPNLNLSTLDGTTGFRLIGVRAFDFSGISVNAAGDVNGDGFADLIVGALGADPGSIDYAGSSYVVFGKAGGFAPNLNLSTLNGATGFRLDGVAANDYSGRAVTSAGDVNGDGFADLLVGAHFADPNGNASGSSYVVFGKAGGFASRIKLSALNGTTGFRLDGVAAGDYSGRAVSGAEDVNSDGFADLIVGAPITSANGSASGSSYVVFGKAGGFASIINLSTLDGNTGFKLFGLAANDFSGTAVSAAGDVNGDSFADLIIGANGADPNGLDSGSSYVVFGQAGGFASSINLSSLDGITGFRLDGVAADDNSGFAVSAAGDVNGDGFADLMVGAHFADPNGSASGSSYVVFGKASGFASSLNLSTLDGATGFRLDGVTADDRSGTDVSAAGDVNGDGFADLAIGAHYADPNTINLAGSSYVVFGRAPDAAVTRLGSAAGQYISGGPLDDSLQGDTGEDVLEGRSGADVLDGGADADTASYAHAPAAVIASLALPSGNTGVAAGDSFVLIENLEGSKFADTLNGDISANRLTGGKGKDTLKGGKGKDTFVYRFATESRPSARDVIADFNPGKKSTRVDRIDLSAIDAKKSIGGNQAFTFRGTKLFTGKGQIRLKKSGSNVIIQGNTGGSTAPEFEIVLKGLVGKIGRITKKDFKL